MTAMNGIFFLLEMEDKVSQGNSENLTAWDWGNVHILSSFVTSMFVLFVNVTNQQKCLQVDCVCLLSMFLWHTTISAS